MACKHEQLRCTDNVYYCPVCGCSWVAEGKDKGEETPPSEAKKTASKRKPKKEAEQ